MPPQACPSSQRRHGGAIPPTAVEVNVHNIADPYFILVSDVKDSPAIIEKINEELRVTVKQLGSSNKYTEQKEHLEVGTVAIVHRETVDGVDLPAWYCRAIVGNFNAANSKYSAFLPDYGDHIEVCRKSFLTVPHNILSIPFITFFISLYKIWPVGKRQSQNKKKYELVCQKDWCPKAINLTMQLVSSCSRCYFDQISTKGNGTKVGELYLVIDNRVVALSKALIVANLAVDLVDLLYSDESNVLQETTSDEEDEETFELSHNVENSTPVKTKRNVYHEILVCSDMECERLNNINEARFDSAVIKALAHLEIKSLRRIQSYIWPAINKALDVLAVGPSKSGKTIGYAAPIASMITYTKKYQEDSSYPMALVLCSSSNDGLHIQSIFKELLAAHPEIKVVGAFNGCTDRVLSAMIYSGCHIFISTPAFLIRCFERNKYNRKLLKFDNISHLVIDNLDVLLEKHRVPLMQLLGKHTLIGKKHSRNSNMLALQIVAAARQWTTSIGEFIKIFKNPYICIGSFAEASIFCGVRLTPRMVNSDQKNVQLAQILENHYRLVKTIIVCANSEEAEELNKFLSANFKILYVHNKMKFTEIYGMKELWNAGVSGMYEVMICTDVVLSTLKITDATWLIHYSLAVPTKSAFLFRFSTLMSNLKTNSSKARVTIFIDNTNDVQYRGIIDLIKRSGYILTQKQLLAAECIYVNLERKKERHHICNNVKALGQCPKHGNCLYRHCILSDVDTPMTPVQIGDRVELTITYVHNATHFSAKIVQYLDANNERHQISDIDHIKITNKVHNYYSDKRNRRRCREVEIGEIYAFEEPLDVFQRVQVINISGKDPADDVDIVDLRFIDTGNVRNHVKAFRLKQMPKELREAPAHIVEVFLANVLPYDDENEWNQGATDYCMEWFRTELRPRTAFLQGKVCLHLGNTLWVNSLESRSRMLGRREIITSSLTKNLINKQHGIENIQHMVLLRKLCLNAGMTFEDIDDPNLA